MVSRQKLETTFLNHASHLELWPKRWPHSLNFSYMWLRDHCRCEQCYNPNTFQRMKDFCEINPQIKPLSLTSDKQNLKIVWPDGHESSYALQFLWQNSHNGGSQIPIKKTKQVLWNQRSVPSMDDITVPYDKLLEKSSSQEKLIKNILTYGFGFVSEVCQNVEATQQAVEAVAPVSKTFYGEMWNLLANLEHADTAYSNESIRPHTDVTYFTEAVRLQIFHCLKLADKGGETILVDGFKCADVLRSRHPRTYEFLSKAVIPSEFVEDGRHHKVFGTVLNHHAYTKELRQIRYNIHDRAPLCSLPLDKIDAFYTHFKIFTEIIRRPENQFEIQLQPGSVIFIDNWRVMHGRQAFSGGQRYLCGCYVDNCEFESAARVNKLLGNL